MENRFFYRKKGPLNVAIIAEKTGCSLSDPSSRLQISAIKPLEEAGANDLSFLSNMKYFSRYKNTGAGAVIAALEVDITNNHGSLILKSENPYHSYALAIDLFYESARHIKAEIKKTAYISPSAKIGRNCYIGHNVVIEDEAEIGDNCIIESGTFVDFKVKIGNRARIDSSVSISHSIIGNDVVILAGARIGQDGFGFATDKGIYKKIYHTGRVIIGNDVEIGGNSCIDRGAMSDTIIEDLCRIDNLVQIGHNVHIKKGSIIVAQVGIAGSSKIGAYCALGGQVGVAGHITITDGVQVAGQGGVIQDIRKPGIMGGTPAVPIRDWHKQSVIMKSLIKSKNI